MHRVARMLGAAVLIVGPLLLTGQPAGAQFSTTCSSTVPPDDFLTGGGFIIATATDISGMPLQQAQARKNFGVGGGCKQRGDGPGMWGHLEYIDHGMGLNVHWITITAYTNDIVFLPDPNARFICGTARTNSPPSSGIPSMVNFVVRAADQGLPDSRDKFDIQLTDMSGLTVFYTTFVVGSPHTLEGGNIVLHQPNPSTMGPITGESCPAALLLPTLIL